MKNRLLLVGDAAHHTNPLTGGGIAAAMRGGQIAAEVVSAGLARGDLSERFLRGYEELCLKRFGNKHLQIMKFRRYLLSRNRDDQIRLYKVIRAYLESGKKFVFGMPAEVARFAVSYLMFK